MAWKLKGCPRCNGDVAVERGTGVEECINCGWNRDPRKRVPIQEYGRHSNSIMANMSSGKFHSMVQPVGIIDLLVS